MTRRAGLTHNAVMETALKLADKMSPEPLTLNALADKLNIQKPSLYHYVDGLPGLQRELALTGTRELRDVLLHAGMGKAGDDAVFAIADAFRAFIHAHPGVYALMMRASRNRKPIDKELGAAEGEIVELVVAALRAYQLSEEDKLHAVRGLRSFVHGFATLENAGGFGLALDLDESFRRLTQTFIQGIRAA